MQTFNRKIEEEKELKAPIDQPFIPKQSIVITEEEKH